jgi:hypothetical protein
MKPRLTLSTTVTAFFVGLAFSLVFAGAIVAQTPSAAAKTDAASTKTDAASTKTDAASTKTDAASTKTDAETIADLRGQLIAKDVQIARLVLQVHEANNQIALYEGVTGVAQRRAADQRAIDDAQKPKP